MDRTRIKICGVRDVETARAAWEAGADAIGLVFAEASPRFIAPDAAWKIVSAAPMFMTTVGVFVNATVDRYSGVEETCPTDFGQLHGEESEQVVRQCGPRVIKSVRFNAHWIEGDLRRWSRVSEVDAILVDGSLGGAGTTFDWAALARVKAACEKPLIIAGGLTPENVGEAIRLVRPFAVDVSSGVEQSPGVKDPSRIRSFCAAVRAADSAASRG